MALLTRRSFSTLLTRALSHHHPPPPFFSSSLRSLTIHHHHHHHHHHPLLTPSPSSTIPSRFKSSGSGYSPLKDPSPNWSNRPPKETILLDGCDYEHWLIILEFPTDPKPSEDEMINAYVKTLASVLGSEEEAKTKIYSVCTSTYTGFGALISEELTYKVKELPGVLWVLPDSYLDVPNKDYGGDLFVDGKVIPRPQYRFDQRQSNTRRPRPRYDRRRESMPVERREPLQRDNWNQDRREPVSQPDTMGGQDSYRGGPPSQPGMMGGRDPYKGAAPSQPGMMGGQDPYRGGAPSQPATMGGGGAPSQPGTMGGHDSFMDGEASSDQRRFQ